MNKEEIKHFKSLLRQGSLRHMNILLDDNFQKELQTIIKDYEKLQQENEKLKDNWDKLRKWLKKELGDRINPNKDKWLTGVYDAYRETIDKMQEIEQGSDD